MATASAGEVSVTAIPPEGAGAGSRSRVWTWPVLGTIAIFVLAEAMVRLELMFTGFLPAPTEIVRALFLEVQTAVYWQAVLETLQGWALGLGLAVVLAVPIGIIVGLNGWLQRASRFVVDFIRPIPSIAILPVLMLVSGIDPQLKVYMAAIAAFSPCSFKLSTAFRMSTRSLSTPLALTGSIGSCASCSCRSLGPLRTLRPGSGWLPRSLCCS